MSYTVRWQHAVRLARVMDVSLLTRSTVVHKRLGGWLVNAPNTNGSASGPAPRVVLLPSPPPEATGSLNAEEF